MLRSQILLRNWDTGKCPQLKEVRSTSIRSALAGADLLCPVSLAFHNEPRGVETVSLQTRRERVLRKISEFIPDAEDGLRHITGMQKILGLLLFKVNRKSHYVCFSLKFDSNLDSKNFKEVDTCLRFFL